MNERLVKRLNKAGWYLAISLYLVLIGLWAASWYGMELVALVQFSEIRIERVPGDTALLQPEADRYHELWNLYIDRSNATMQSILDWTWFAAIAITAWIIASPLLICRKRPKHVNKRSDRWIAHAKKNSILLKLSAFFFSVAMLCLPSSLGMHFMCQLRALEQNINLGSGWSYRMSGREFTPVPNVDDTEAAINSMLAFADTLIMSSYAVVTLCVALGLVYQSLYLKLVRPYSAFTSATPATTTAAS